MSIKKDKRICLLQILSVTLHKNKYNFIKEIKKQEGEIARNHTKT